MEESVYSPVLDKDLHIGNKVVVYEVFEKIVNTENSFNKNVDEKKEIKPFEKNSEKNGERIFMKIAEWDFSAVKPWVITVGQMDEDEPLEIFMGCYYETLYYNKADTRPYFFKYNDGVLVKQWTGSYLNSLAFHHAEFVDHDSDGFDELRVYERVKEKGVYIDRVNYYGIRGFYPYLME